MNPQQKPTLIQIIAWTTLASGIVNLFWGLIASGAVLATIIGVVCIPLTILPTLLGIFELIYAAKLFSNPPQPVNPSTNIAIFEIASVLTGNVFSMSVGILSLVFYGDTVVKEYFARVNAVNGDVAATPAPVAPPASASLPDPEPASSTEPDPSPDQVLVEELTPPQTEAVPAEEPPVKPKRTPRKTAKK